VVLPGVVYPFEPASPPALFEELADPEPVPGPEPVPLPALPLPPDPEDPVPDP